MKNITYIGAGAGSGKTFRLTELITELIENKKAKPEEIILTTYTVKAASEFKEKVKAALYSKGCIDAAQRIDHALVGTIHSVCQRMIDKYWFLLGISPNMGVMTEEDASFYTNQSIATLPTSDEIKKLRAIARFFDVRIMEGYTLKGIDYDFWKSDLKRIIDFSTNYEITNYTESINKSLEFINKFKNNKSVYIDKSIIPDLFRDLRNNIAGNNRIRNKDNYYTDFDRLENESNEQTISWMKDLSAYANRTNNYAPLLENLASLWQSNEVTDKQKQYVELIFTLAARWRNAFAEFKRKHNLIDFNDMEKYMKQLLEREDVRKEISQSYKYLFVDEFQDSSPIQAKIFDGLSNLMERSYWVGDSKQAIYGFRGSDTELTNILAQKIGLKENGCDTDTLDTCWRSLPEIVENNNAIFLKTFKGKIDPDEKEEEKKIKLKTHRENTDNIDSLRFFHMNDGEDVALQIKSILEKEPDTKYSDIAVLARNNYELNGVISNLVKYGIPNKASQLPVAGSKTCTLLECLLRIISSNDDSLAKASVAKVTGKYNTAEIVDLGIDANGKLADYLSDVDLIQQASSLRPKLEKLSVSSIIEDVIVTFNLYNVTKRIEGSGEYGKRCLQSIISLSYGYEERCLKMGLPATIDGFIEYLEDYGLLCSGDPDGVELTTYHSSKGLDWKYVILLSLDSGNPDTRKFLQREVYGTHFVYSQKPTITTPYPTAYVRVLPWIFGSANKTKIPAEITAITDSLQEIKDLQETKRDELNRLFYVGMTRPKDCLILALKDNDNRMALPEALGLSTNPVDFAEDEIDLFDTGHPFKNYTLKSEVTEAYKSEATSEAKDEYELKVPTFTLSDEPVPNRYLSPSGIKKMGRVISSHNFNKRIKLVGDDNQMNVVGDCIHQIFAGIELHKADENIVRQTIKDYGLENSLTEPKSIIEAWNQLVGFLKGEFGDATETFHERPFRLEKDGQTIVGSMDLVWETKEDSIVVDYKTCPMGQNVVLNEMKANGDTNEWFVGKYAGQLDAYTEALKAGGVTVLHRFIYYAVSGILVKL